MSVDRLLEEAAQFSSRSVDFARGVGEASTGESLGRLVKHSLAQRPGAHRAVRAAVTDRVEELEGAGEAIGFFLLAADCATTAALERGLSGQDRRQLRRFWDDLLSP